MSRSSTQPPVSGANNKKIFLFDFNHFINTKSLSDKSTLESLLLNILENGGEIVFYSSSIQLSTMRDFFQSPRLQTNIIYSTYSNESKNSKAPPLLPAVESVLKDKKFLDANFTLPKPENIIYISPNFSHMKQAKDKGYKPIWVREEDFLDELRAEIKKCFVVQADQDEAKNAKPAIAIEEKKAAIEIKQTAQKTLAQVAAPIFNRRLSALDKHDYAQLTDEDYAEWEKDSNFQTSFAAYFEQPNPNEEIKDIPKNSVKVTEQFCLMHDDIYNNRNLRLCLLEDIENQPKMAARAIVEITQKGRGRPVQDTISIFNVTTELLTQAQAEAEEELRKKEEEQKKSGGNAVMSLDQKQPDAPSSRLWKLDVKDVVCTVKKPYGTEDPDWFKNRFEQGSQNGFAYVSGTTFAGKDEYTNEKALDAVAARIYRKDEVDFVGRRTLATFDALGHGHDEKQTASISQENTIMINALDQVLSQEGDINIRDAFLSASRDVSQNHLLLGKKSHEGGCAVSLAVVEHDPIAEKMKCQVVNFGDTMTLVLDSKTLAIKKILPACARIRNDIYDLRNTTKSPVPAHLASENLDLLQAQSFDVDPNDLIIQFTDGITHELKCEDRMVTTTTSKDLGYLESKLTPQALEKALLSINRKGPPWNEYDIATAIVGHIQRVQDQNRTEELKLQKEFLQWMSEHGAEKDNDLIYYLDLLNINTDCKPAEVDKYTFEQYFSWLAKNLQHERKNYPVESLKNDLNKYLVHIQNCYKETRGIPLTERTVKGLFQQIFRKPTLKGGDCATVAVMRVPDPDVELIRALINNPDHDQVRPQLIATIIKKKEKDKNFDLNAWQNRIIDTLRAEYSIAPKSRGMPDSINKKLVYKISQLNKVDIVQLLESTTENIKKLEDLQRRIQEKNQGNLIKLLNSTHNGKPYTVEKRNQKFVEFWRSNNFILVHKNKRWDSIFGLKNTATWRKTMETIRKDAVNQLIVELKSIKNKCTSFEDTEQQYDETKLGALKIAWEITDQLKLLNEAREMPIFNEQRNNSIFAGAFGRTEAVKWIDARIEENNEKLKQLQKKNPEIFKRVEPPTPQGQ